MFTVIPVFSPAVVGFITLAIINLTVFVLLHPLMALVVLITNWAGVGGFAALLP
jgi:hypothetical protein